MRPRAMTARRLLAAAATAGAAIWLVAACADRIAGPGALLPLAISDQQRSALSSGLTFAARGGTAIAARGDAVALATAFDRLVEQIDRNDARGAHTALEEARAALEARRAEAQDPLALMEVERMAIALEHAALLVHARAAPSR